MGIHFVSEELIGNSIQTTEPPALIRDGTLGKCSPLSRTLVWQLTHVRSSGDHSELIDYDRPRLLRSLLPRQACQSRGGRRPCPSAGTAQVRAGLLHLAEEEAPR